MNKTERKITEKIALSAYAIHLYEGLTIRGNYSLGEVIRYWRQAKEDAGAMCPQLLGHDQNIFRLIDEYKYNVERLERQIAEYVEKVNPMEIEEVVDRDDRLEIAVAKLPAQFELRAFPGIPMEISPSYSYVNDHGQLQLVIVRKDTRDHFGKGTFAEIRAQLATEVK